MSPVRRDGLVYGVGALHAAARGDRMMWALHRAALSNGIVPYIPAVAVAEGYRTEARGDRLAELLDGTQIEPFDGEAARRSGELAARCDTVELASVAVIELADRRNCAVVAQRQAVLRNAAALLGHELVLYAV
ncbi:MAG: twitching motility protein PilT [Acidimicrobiales bacterium]